MSDFWFEMNRKQRMVFVLGIVCFICAVILVIATWGTWSITFAVIELLIGFGVTVYAVVTSPTFHYWFEMDEAFEGFISKKKKVKDSSSNADFEEDIIEDDEDYLVMDESPCDPIFEDEDYLVMDASPRDKVSDDNVDSNDEI